tara:strand:+ start:469 stop:1140 length:672 start_codon:yes stop_codon:yes gene_type:complete
MFCGQIEEHLSFKRKILITNEIDWTRDGWELVFYEDDWSHPQKMVHGLDHVKTETCFLHLEDMPLYDKPNEEKISEYLKLIKEDKLDYVKMIRADGLDYPIIENELYTVPIYSNNLFAVQPSLWNVSKLKEIYQRVKDTGYSEVTAKGFEPAAQQPSREMLIRGSFVYNDADEKRGMFHYDSGVYPFICTAVVKGNWNTKEYPKEMEMLFKKYNINKNDRGTL